NRLLLGHQLRQNIAPEIVRTRLIGRVVMKGLAQGSGGEQIIPHGGVDAFGSAGNRGGIRVLLMKRENAALGIGFDNAELVRVPLVNRNGGYGTCRVEVLMELDHVRHVHTIDVISAEDGDHMRLSLLNQIDVLIDGVGRSLIPGFASRTHLRRHRNDELVLQYPARLPSFVQMLQQALAAKLREDVDGIDSGIDEIAQYEIDNPVFSSERNGG